MDAAEKSVIIKIIESLAVSDTKEEKKEEVQPIYLVDPAAYIDQLKSRKSSFSEKTKFSIGETIIWKEGLKNKRLPEYKQPAIVIKLLSTPITDREDGTQEEELDITLGFITDEDEFLIFNYDSRRFVSFQK